MFIIVQSGSGKTNALLNIIQQDNNIIDKIYLYAKDLEEAKYQLFIKKHENAGIKHLNDPKAFIEYSNTIDDVYSNIDDYDAKRKRKMLILFDDMIADIMTNKRFQTIIKELFVWCRKLNISLVFITQSYFSVPKEVRLNSVHYLIMKIDNRRELQQITIGHSADIDYKDEVRLNSAHYLIMKIDNRRELQQITIGHSADIDYKDFLKIYRNCTREPYSFLTVDTALPADDPMTFRKNFLDAPL